MSVPIPQPPTIPFLGNVASMDLEVPLNTFELFAKKYGEIYQLNLIGDTLIFVSSYALGNELSDDTRFRKGIACPLREPLACSATSPQALEHEPNWGIAHRLLMPAFGTIALKGMLEEMRDISNQLILKWERFGPEAIIDPSDDFTRLAIDTIAYCSMSYRLNSFYKEQQPEFAVAMSDFLRESGLRSKRPRIVQAFMRGSKAKYAADMKLMKDLADEIVAARKAHPIAKHDLLDTMLNSRDPKTGEGMTAESISRNLLTFLVAGHETSSGMLSFMVYFLLKNPEKMRKLRVEVDEVLGDRPAQYEDFAKLPYLIAVMRETLRLTPSGASPRHDPNRGHHARWKIHRDPAVWGDDAEEFKPERMLDGKFEALPPNAWQPFGFGLRGCIGRAFAWQEVTLVMASIIQKFDLSFVDPSYTLALMQTLTVKPKDLHIRASVRTAPVQLRASPSSVLMANRDLRPKPKKATGAALDVGIPFYVLYGSNTGTSEAFALRITSEAPSYGFRPSVGTLDSALEKVPKDGPVIIITASFEGEPADNAAQFVDWLRNIDGNELEGCRFAVFGCGNSDWATTFQKIPTLCDELFEKRGGTRLVARGSGDAGSGDLFQKFDEFEAGMWEALSKEYSTSRSESLAETLEVKSVNAGQERAAALRQGDTFLGRVVENRVLTKNGPEKRHIELELPEGTTARAGDYIAILPQNPMRDVHRVLARFSLSNEEEVVLSSTGPTNLPTDKAVRLADILAGYLELSQPATTRDLGILSQAATSEATRAYLKTLKSSYHEAVQGKRLSVFEILESHSDIALPIGTFLQMLPSMRIRQYSISSSPLWNHERATVTFSVLDAPSLSGQTPHPFLGVGSNYLASLLPGDRVQMVVRPSPTGFHLPKNPLTPVVMFCSGAGIAPMRGFIQERAAQKASGRRVGPMVLFFGCRSPETDFLYSDTDLAEWTAQGIVDVRPAFSRSPQASHGCKYVQHRIRHDGGDIIKAYRDGASFFTCGSASVARGVKAALVEIMVEDPDIEPESATAAAVRFEQITKGRYATDIFD
ncbi:fatty acid hydroxylase [Mycena filopes]|nr:fatty acid hydroxylase [Mycena filopes]